MSSLKVEYKKIKELIPYCNNSRTHSDEQVLQIASSIKEFGFTNPVLIDEQGGIIAGHGRIMAAQKLKMDEVPTITLNDLSEAQKKAYIIADNKLALNSGWDDELLKIELEQLKELDFDLGLIGFSDDELALLMLGEDDPASSDDKPSDGSLADRFLIPPFSVLNAREGWWQERKRAWLAIGIKSELGRGGGQEPHHTRQQSPVTQTEHSTTAGQPDRTRGSTGSARRQRQASVRLQQAATGRRGREADEWLENQTQYRGEGLCL